MVFFVQAAGKYKQKGREYLVEDGDIIFFKANAGAGLGGKKKWDSSLPIRICLLCMLVGWPARAQGIVTMSVFLQNPSWTQMSSNLIHWYFPVVKSFWNFAPSMAVMMPCCVQTFKVIGQLRQKLSANKVSQYFSSRWNLEGYQIWQLPGTVLIQRRCFARKGVRIIKIR